jgi:hypothetical protein
MHVGFGEVIAMVASRGTSQTVTAVAAANPLQSGWCQFPATRRRVVENALLWGGPKFFAGRDGVDRGGLRRRSGDDEGGRVV